MRLSVNFVQSLGIREQHGTMELGEHHEDLGSQGATPPCRPATRGNDRRQPARPLSVHSPRRRFLSLTAGAAALPAFLRIARAQTYPTRPVRLLVGAAPGGT